MITTFTQMLRDKIFLCKAKLRGALSSLTMWFNGVMAAAPAALLYAQDQLPMMRDYMPTNMYGYAFGATVLGNVALRFFRTTGALENK